jgi:hypothetical protein
MTDDQHMWVCGSFFQFSAGEGWEGLKGFDISPDDASKDDEKGNLLAKLQSGNKDGKPPGAYVVQARKGIPPNEVDEDGDVESFVRSRLWTMPTLEDRDKKLVAPRLARAYESMDSLGDKDLMVRHLDSLPKVYASLIKMDQFAFTFGMQAQLAADLVGDPRFDGNDAQIANLKSTFLISIHAWYLYSMLSKSINIAISIKWDSDCASLPRTFGPPWAGPRRQ